MRIDPRLVQGIIQTVDSRFDQLQRQQPYRAYGTVATVDTAARTCTVYVSADPAPSAGFRYPPRMDHPLVGSRVRVVIDPRGDRYVEEALGTLAAPVWIAPTFQNSWVNYGGSFPTAAYYKDARGYVHLRGLIKNGTVGAVAFTLPAGYHSAEYHHFAAPSNETFAVVRVDEDGNVQIGNPAQNAWVDLGGISFLAA